MNITGHFKYSLLVATGLRRRRHRCRQVHSAGIDEIIDLLLESVDATVVDLVGVLDAVFVLVLCQNVAECP